MKVSGNPNITESYGTPHPSATDVEGVVVVGYDPSTNKWLALRWLEGNSIWLVGGGREKGETFQTSAIRELNEETGYSKFIEQVQLGGPITSYYYNEKKAKHRRSYSFSYLFILDSTAVGRQQLEAHEQFAVIWLDYNNLRASLMQTGGGVEHWLAVLERAKQYTDDNQISSN